MFDYPFMKSSKTMYDTLGILPTSSERQVRDAISGTKEKLVKKQKKLEKRKGILFRKFPRLEEIYKEIDVAKKSKNMRSQLKSLLEEKIHLESDVRVIEPSFKELKEELRSIEREINELNAMKLDNMEEREKYDNSHPPCSLLKLRQFNSTVFSDQGTLLHQIRKEIDHFLREEKGLACYHPSDLTRIEFSNDFIYNSYLDEE